MAVKGRWVFSISSDYFVLLNRLAVLCYLDSSVYTRKCTINNDIIE